MPERKLRVGIISPWASRMGGGVFEAVVAHTDIVSALGAEPVVFALVDAHSDVDRDRLARAEVHLGHRIGPNQIGYSFELGRMLDQANLDLLHLHGIWMGTSHTAARWAVATGRPYVISPHGMLDPWITRRGRVKKLAARLGYEQHSWSHASLFHALTQSEADDIVRETGRTAVAIIPNAVISSPRKADTTSDRSPGFVYLGRIHQKKNINSLIDAWLNLYRQYPDKTPALTIAGWGDPNDVSALTNKIDGINSTGLRFIGPVYGADKQSLIENAVAMCLPSHSEGLPMVILEAWAAGIPTAMSQQCHLPEGLAVGAAIDCGTEPATIGAALATLANENIEARACRSKAARSLVASRFSRDAVQGLWSETYGRLLREQALGGSQEERR